jgi:choline-sulfatase
MRALIAAACVLTIACSAKPGEQPPPAPSARNLVIITIDTLRADRVGAYGYNKAHTRTLDTLAREGVRFSHAYATAPITLTSHASVMTGRYPAGHGARHNGIRIDLHTPTLADKLTAAGFSTAGFVAAYPLDRRFGLSKGFQTYGDRMPPSSNGHAINERPGRDVVDEALTWLASHHDERFFLWVHLFEPHAPYGDPANPRGLTASQRYDEDVAEADRQAGRLLEALAPVRNDTVVVAAADHGESFGEHGEVGHSIFLYDTTLRVPLIMTGPGVPPGRVIDDVVDLIDIAPTVIAMLGVSPLDADGIDLRPAFQGTALPERDLYAETLAPLLDFGWSPLYALRSGQWKYIDAPKPELFDLARDPKEEHDLSGTDAKRLAQFHETVGRRSGPPAPRAAIDPEAKARLEALG